MHQPKGEKTAFYNIDESEEKTVTLMYCTLNLFNWHKLLGKSGWSLDIDINYFIITKGKWFQLIPLSLMYQNEPLN